MATPITREEYEKRFGKPAPVQQQVEQKKPPVPITRAEAEKMMSRSKLQPDTLFQPKLGVIPLPITKAQKQEFRGDLEQTGKNIVETVKRTGGKLQSSLEAGASAKQSPFETGLQTAGLLTGGAFGLATDIGIGAVKTLLPQRAEDYLADKFQKGAEKVISTRPVQSAIQAYQGASPRTQRNIEAGAEILSALPIPPVIRGAKQVLPKVAETTTDLLNKLPSPQNKLQEIGVKSINKQLDNFITSKKSLHDQVNFFETKRNTPVREIISEPYIFSGLKVSNGKVDATEAIYKLQGRIDTALDVKRPILKELDEKIVPIDKEILRQRAFKNLNEDKGLTPADKKIVQRDINVQLNALPDSLTISQLDELRAAFRQGSRTARQTQKTGSEYTILENTFRDTIFDVTDNLPFDTNKEFANLNKFIKDQIATKELLDKFQGQVVKGGRLGRYFGRSVGALAGSQGGIFTTILGAEIGDTVSKILINNQLGSSLKMKLVRELTDDPRVIAEAERLLKSVQQYNPLDTPALTAGAIRMNPPIRESSVQLVPAKRGPVGVDPKTGRFMRTYTSEPQSPIPNMSRQNTANNITNTVPSGIIPTQSNTLPKKSSGLINRIKNTPNKQGGFIRIGKETPKAKLPKKGEFNEITKGMWNSVKEIGDNKIARVNWDTKPWKLVDTTDFQTVAKDDYKAIAEFQTRDELYDFIKKQQPTPTLPKPKVNESVSLPKNTTDLITEARKYKSAEEFVKAKMFEKPKYGMQHRPTFEDSPPAYNLLEGDMLPRDVYEKPEWSIASGRSVNTDISARESWEAIKKIKGKPEAEITIYRASPKNELNIGDWVTFSKNYAKGEGAYEGSKVFAYKVKAKDIFFAGDDINEFGYFPKSQLEQIWKEANKK